MPRTLAITSPAIIQSVFKTNRHGDYTASTLYTQTSLGKSRLAQSGPRVKKIMPKLVHHGSQSIYFDIYLFSLQLKAWP